MPKLEKAILEMNSIENARRSPGLPRVGFMILLTLAYFIAMLSVSVVRLDWLVWFGIYPILFASVSGVGYGKVLVRSLVVLPFVAVIGIFNPIIETRTAFHVGPVPVSVGWLSFCSILLRGLFSVQCVLLLVYAYGFNGLLRGLETLRFPKFLTRQLGMVYRYLRVLMEEALSMRRARESRGMGRRIPFKAWGPFIGQLFIRTVDRASRIQRAMESRDCRKDSFS